MKKIPHFIPLIIAVPILWLAASGHAQHRPESGRPGDRPGLRAGNLAEHLDLTEEQREQIKSIRRETARKHIQQQADVRLARLDLKALMDTEQPDRKKIHTQLRKIAQLQGDMRISQVDQRLDIRQLLTPEQRQKAKKMRARGRRPNRPQGDGPRRGGPREEWGHRDPHREGGEHDD